MKCVHLCLALALGAAPATAQDEVRYSVRPGVNGIMIYSTVGAASLPFNGGTLCVGSPFFRTAFQNSGGSGACSGVFGFDFNAYIATGFDPALIAGAQAWAQYWSRDPGSPTGGTNLTNGLHLYVAP